MPERLERRALLDVLHRLRSPAHVVDMHQLDKDLLRLLELDSLIAKTAALCAERTSDAVALTTVSEIETLSAH